MPRRLQAAIGAALALFGGAILIGLFILSNSDHPYMFVLGIPLMLLISAAAQAPVFGGVWLCWTAASRRGPSPESAGEASRKGRVSVSPPGAGVPTPASCQGTQAGS